MFDSECVRGVRRVRHLKCQMSQVSDTSDTSDTKEDPRFSHWKPAAQRWGRGSIAWRSCAARAHQRCKTLNSQRFSDLDRGTSVAPVRTTPVTRYQAA